MTINDVFELLIPEKYACEIDLKGVFKIKHTIFTGTYVKYTKSIFLEMAPKENNKHLCIQIFKAQTRLFCNTYHDNPAS